MDENKQEEIGNLEVEALDDADLESASGGHNFNSNGANACCPNEN